MNGSERARSIAKRLGIQTKGTIGLLIRAKQNGIITEIRSFIDRMESNGFYIGHALRAEALRIAGEH